MNRLFQEYLEILKLPVRKPDLNYLNELIASHLQNIPFENISKIYYKKKYGILNIPDFEEYIERISEYKFGGTCYSLNYYFNQLLDQLGFDVLLCGADMSNPDVHLVSIVRLGKLEYIVDVGYAAPFLEALPRDLEKAYEIKFGYDKYLVLPRDNKGNTQVQQFRNDILRHSYTVKPHQRSITEFNEVIKASYDQSATFMNTILVTKFSRTSSTIINDLLLVEVNNEVPSKIELKSNEELIKEIVRRFNMPIQFVTQVIEDLNVS